MVSAGKFQKVPFTIKDWSKLKSKVYIKAAYPPVILHRIWSEIPSINLEIWNFLI
jgi:hypothetical protein